MRRYLRSARPLLALAALLVPAALWAQRPGEKPYERWRYFNDLRWSPGVANLGQALQSAREDLLRRMIPATVIQGAPTATNWEPVGPLRINDFNQSTGRASTVAVHPGDPNTLYVGGAQGGVWRSVDGGSTWTALTDMECSLAMGSLAIDPVDPNIIYAGTGEQHFSADSYYGCGVLRSADGGDTWTQLAPMLRYRRIGKLIIDPESAGTTDATTLFVASDDGLWRSTDSGASWTRSEPGIWTDVLISPANPARVWAAQRGGGVYLSEDSGASFARRTGWGQEFGRVHLAFAPSNPSRIFAAAHAGTDALLLNRSDDGGDSWTPVAAGGADCRQCWYDMAIAVDATDQDRLYFGAIRLYRSDDGGVSFSGLPAQIHVDQHFILPDTATPGRVYVANDGGIYRSDDSGLNWTSLNTNLELTQFYSGITIDPTNEETLLGGTQDNGTLLRVSSAPQWDQVMGGDGGFTAIDPTNPEVRYMEFQWGPPVKRIGLAYGPAFDLPFETADRGLFIPPIAMDPYEPNTLYFGAKKLYRTRNAAESWEEVPIPSNDAINAIGLARSTADVLYYGARNRAYRSLDGGESFTDITAGLPVRIITDFAVHPEDPMIVWVVFSGFGTGHVYRSTNGGDSWQNVSGSLPDLPVNAIALDPEDPELAYLGTDLGVFSGGAGGGWDWLGEGLPMVAVFDIAIEPNTRRLVAATHGRGMFQLPLEAPLKLRLRGRGVGVDTLSVLDDPRSDSLRVGVYGTGWTSTPWTAEVVGGSPWLQLQATEGIGRGFVRWTLDPAADTPGFLQDTIRLRLQGTEEVADLPIDFQAYFLVDVDLDRDTTGAEVDAAAPEVTSDSVQVGLSGTVLPDTRWVAESSAAWIRFDVGSGLAGERVRWSRDPSGLSEGIHAATIVVSVEGFPEMRAEVVDTVALLGPLSLRPIEPPETTLSVTGLRLVRADSLTLDLLGFGAPEAAWTATAQDAPWFELQTLQGTGDAELRWAVDASALDPGDYSVRVEVSLDGVPESTEAFDVAVRVLAPIDPEDVATGLLEGSSLDTEVEALLDAVGNDDGELNLGDFLAWLALCEGSPGACSASAPAAGGGP